jgi:AcrR family transcriptional regulator
MSTAEVKRPRGRPRDPMIEPRMYDAALTVYAERGWYGFSLEAVGRQAGVGQGAMYRRWSSKAELLAEAIDSRAPVFEPIDSGDSREELTALARFFVANYRASMGVIGLRMVLDTRTNPELAEQFERQLKGARAVEARGVVRRAFDRGDLRQPTTIDLVLEIVTGTTLSHVLYTPLAPAASEAEVGIGYLTSADVRFIDRLVQSLLV